MNKNKTKLMGFLIVAMAVVMIPFSTDAGTRIASRQLVSNPVTGEGPIFQADGSMSSGAVGASNDLDDAYDNGDTIDYSSGNGAVIMNFPAAGTTDPIVEDSNTYQVRNLWIQANDADSGDISTLYYTTSSDVTPNDFHMMGIMSTDNGSNNFLRWQISSLGIFQGTGFGVNNYPSTGDPIHQINQEQTNFNLQQDNIDFQIKSVNEPNMFFLDASADKIGIGTSTPAYEFDIIGDLAGESVIVNSSTANTGGGLQRLFSEATSGALSGATGTIQVNIPTGARILGVQLRVDTLIEGGFSFNAAYSGGSTQVIGAGINLTKNTKISVMYDPFAATPIAASEVDILLTSIGGDFTAGVARALVYYEQLIPMDNNP